MSKESSRFVDLWFLLFLVLCWPSQGEAFFSFASISPALERMASYGYYMMGYDQPSYGYNDEIELYEKEPIWDGHIDVGSLVSPIVEALGADSGLYGETDAYGNPERVVKGFDNRLGLRVAVPYVGDFQITREIGPGRFLDKLGPGKYPYGHLPSKGKGHLGHGHTSYNNLNKGHEGYQNPYPPPKVVYVQKDTYDESSYQSMKNYPWYRR